MPDSSRRPSADQGLFLRHFSTGKSHYDNGRLEDAERELEEAYLLKPRDHKVLNLLGLVYFKGEKYEKAEEVYRKLASESPEAQTLFYNLGLIYFKLNRLEDAELAFLKALELSKENPKINFYLGSIYERMRRFQDAIYQYRQAGANIMARRMEDRIAPRPKAAAGRTGPEDTAEFKGAAPAQGPAPGGQKPETEPSLVPAKPVHPVSDVILADTAPRRARNDTARFTAIAPPARPPDVTRPPDEPPVHTLPPVAPAAPAPGTPASSDIVSFLAGLPAVSRERTGVSGSITGSVGVVTPWATRYAMPPATAARAGEAFRLLQKNFLEVTTSGKVFAKQGTVYSYSGDLTFWVKEPRPGGQAVLVIVTGKGKLLLTDREREMTLVGVDAETIFVQPAHLVACEESLNPRYVRIGEGPQAPEFLALEGQGVTALAVGSRPLTLGVTKDLPVSVAAPSIIMWRGALTPRLVEDRQITAALQPSGQAGPPLVRLEGVGRVLVEQVP